MWGYSHTLRRRDVAYRAAGLWSRAPATPADLCVHTLRRRDDAYRAAGLRSRAPAAPVDLCALRYLSLLYLHASCRRDDAYRAAGLRSRAPAAPAAFYACDTTSAGRALPFLAGGALRESQLSVSSDDSVSLAPRSTLGR